MSELKMIAMKIFQKIFFFLMVTIFCIVCIGCVELSEWYGIKKTQKIFENKFDYCKIEFDNFEQRKSFEIMVYDRDSINQIVDIFRNFQIGSAFNRMSPVYNFHFILFQNGYKFDYSVMMKKNSEKYYFSGGGNLTPPGKVGYDNSKFLRNLIKQFEPGAEDKE